MALVPPTSLGATAGFTPSRNVGQASFADSPVAVASNATTHVAWVFGQGDATLLNLTTPALPFPVTPGTYALTVDLTYAPTDATASRKALARLYFDNDYYGGPVTQDISTTVDGAGSHGGEATLAVTWYFGANSSTAIDIITTGADTAGELSYAAYVQRIA
jgi:hypothetical protein